MNDCTTVWRSNSVHLVVFITDANYHIAGDGKVCYYNYSGGECVIKAMLTTYIRHINQTRTRIYTQCTCIHTRTHHCKNTWITSTIFWSSQLHACCVHDTLQTSLKASLAIWVHSWHFMQTRNSSRGRCVGSNKHQTSPKC